MKPLLFVVLVLACALPLRADILANGNFADGTAHWSGDAQASSGGQGIVISLDPSHWTKISQSFNSHENALDFSITYKPDCSFSKDSKGATLSVRELAKITETRFKKSIHLKRGAWLLMIEDPTDREATYYMIPAASGSTNEQTVNGAIPRIAAHQDKTIFLVFPPGQGTITLLNVALTSTGGNSTSPFSSP